ncbi:MAG: helix-turn-helix domain-containing protein [bacterium]
MELPNKGKSVQEISELLGCHPNSIRSYIHLFKRGGFKALMPQWRGGASQKLCDLGKEYWALLSSPLTL